MPAPSRVTFGVGTTVTHNSDPVGNPPFDSANYTSYVATEGMNVHGDPPHGPYAFDSTQTLYKRQYSPGNWFYRIYFDDGTYKVYQGTLLIETGTFTAVAAP